MEEETKGQGTTEIDYKAKFEEMESNYNKLKSNFDKTSSEVADYKRKEKERMSDDEKKQAEAEEREKRYADLERQIAIRDFADELDDVTDKVVKDKIVQAFANGSIKEALQSFKAWRISNKAELEKQIKAQLMRDNPQATAQGGKSTKTKEDIMAIKDPVERQKEIAANLHLFTQK